MAWALRLGAHYDDALAATARLRTEASSSRFDSALPYAHATTAVALAGLAETDELETQSGDGRRARTSYERRTRRFRTRMQFGCESFSRPGALEEACATEPPDLEHALRACEGEVLASRALALATIGRVDEAERARLQCDGLHQGSRDPGACSAVRAVCALKRRSDDLVDRCDALVEHVFAAGCGDFAVTAYRANPELLSTLLASKPRSRSESSTSFVARGTMKRAEALGLSLDGRRPELSLSAREREVYDLCAKGCRTPRSPGGSSSARAQ